MFFTASIIPLHGYKWPSFTSSTLDPTTGIFACFLFWFFSWVQIKKLIQFLHVLGVSTTGTVACMARPELVASIDFMVFQNAILSTDPHLLKQLL